MNPKTALVVTSIAAPNDVLRSLAQGALAHDIHFWMIGDVPSPRDFQLEGCDFFSLDRQAETGLRTAELTPKRHYARKNIGYLLAARDGADLIIETDDDNFPRDGFWAERTRSLSVPVLSDAKWVNVYRYFTDALIWPRGLPLDEVQTPPPDFDSIPTASADCPIQQGLADDNPDVDAIYRLVLPLPLTFQTGRSVALGRNAWCPFNSQNTTFWRDAFPLLYLPAYCSFRMTDIWRSFVAQRIAWENGWSVLFHPATVYQLRNDHSLMRDFADEVPGYLQNRKIGDTLGALSLKPGVPELSANLLKCYEELVRVGVMEAREIPLLEAWIADLQ